MFYKIREYIRSICFNFCNTLSQIFFFILRDEEYLCKYSINYYSQWESRNLNKSIELDVMEAREDPGWENSGALDKDEYQYWSQNICAIACFKMVSDNLGFSSRDIRSVSFAKESVGYGVYKEVEGEVEGIFWKSFQRFLSEKYKIESRIAKCLTIKKMRKLLLDDKIIFLSVSPFFHRSTDRVKIIERMGHVVLVHGFRSKKGMIEGFFIKDPGGWVENNSQECFVNTNFFLLNYSGRAFIINSINKINKERVLI